MGKNCNHGPGPAAAAEKKPANCYNDPMTVSGISFAVRLPGTLLFGVGLLSWLQAGCWADAPPRRTVAERFATPPGFVRAAVAEDSFAAFLRRLPLKGPQADVLLYDGRRKANDGIYAAVVDLPIGRRDLHQCADAVIRLRAEYLYRYKRFRQIHFNFSNGFRAEYSKWIEGYRIAVAGNRARWELRRGPANTERDLWEFLETVFCYAGTLSLARELVPVGAQSMQGGDVFIQGGSPGHAVIIVDLAVHGQSGEKIFMLAQSFMPAQELQILCNPRDPGRSPWYAADFGAVLTTPEWTFRRTDLRRFPEP
jgi:hypothetical protein